MSSMSLSWVQLSLSWLVLSLSWLDVSLSLLELVSDADSSLLPRGAGKSSAISASISSVSDRSDSSTGVLDLWFAGAKSDLHALRYDFAVAGAKGDLHWLQQL